MMIVDTNTLEGQSSLNNLRTKEDISGAFNNVSIRTIINQLGEKLDVGKPDDDGTGGIIAKAKSHSFQTTRNLLSVSATGAPRSKSRSLLSLPVRIIRKNELAVSCGDGPSTTTSTTNNRKHQNWREKALSRIGSSSSHRQLGLLLLDEKNVGHSAHSRPPVEQILAPDDPASSAMSPISLGSHHCSKKKGRWSSSSRKINPEDLPPAFRVSLESSTRLARKSSSQQGNERKKSKSPGRRNKQDNKHRYYPRPSSTKKLHRQWPPVLKKNSNIGGVSQMELLHSSLSLIRSMACVKSHIRSFEKPPAAPGGSLLKASQDADPADGILFFEDDDEEMSDCAGGGEPAATSMTTMDDPAQTKTSTDATGAGVEKTLASEALPGLASALKSALKSGKCKASLRIRWRGPEIFFIEARSRTKHFHPMYFDDLLEDRFKSSGGGGSDHEGSFGSLLADRFAGSARVSDACPSHPNRPPRRCDDWSDYDEDDADSVVEDQQSISQDNLRLKNAASSPGGSPHSTAAEDGEPLLPADPPAIWITVYENIDGMGGLQWRVKRVWDNSILDSRETERIVADEDLLNMVKNLSGLPAIPTANILNGTITATEGSNNAQQALDGDDDDNISLSNWCIKKFYDIDGEIVDELNMSERSLDEDAMLNEIFALARESSDLAVAALSDHDDHDPAAVLLGVDIPPPPPALPTMESPAANKWKAATTVEQDVPVSKAIKSAMELRREASVRSDIQLSSAAGSSCEESISVLDETDHGGLSQVLVAPATTRKGISKSNDEDDPESFSSFVAAEYRRAVVATGPKTTTTTRQKVKEVEAPAVPGLKITKRKKNKQRKSHGTLADLLSPPPVTTFHGMSP